MKQIEVIKDEINKKSTGVFKDLFDNIFYLLNGEYHRIDGPAIEYANGTKKWYYYGKLHRVDGPAVEGPDGTKYWYFYGKYAKFEVEFYNPAWRKKVELKKFL